MKENKQLQKDYLTINRMYRDLKWLLYDEKYKSVELQSALKKLAELRENLKVQLEN